MRRARKRSTGTGTPSRDDWVRFRDVRETTSASVGAERDDGEVAPTEVRHADGRALGVDEGERFDLCSEENRMALCSRSRSFCSQRVRVRAAMRHLRVALGGSVNEGGAGSRVCSNVSQAALGCRADQFFEEKGLAEVGA